MDEIKEQNIKPPFALTVQIFFYMTLIVLGVVRMLATIPSFFYEDCYGINTTYVVGSRIITFIVFVYAFVGIYSTLKRKPYGVGVLKLSLFYILPQIIFDSSLIFSQYQIAWYAAIQGVTILGGLVFLVYLFRSKKLNEYIPKCERKFGKYGWFGILLFFTMFVLYGFFVGEQIVKNLNSQKVEMAQVKSGNYYTDGYVRFKPLADWKQKGIYQQGDGTLFGFSSPKHNKIVIFSSQMECKSRLDFCESVQSIDQLLGGTKSAIEEIDYGTKVLNTGTLYYNTYKIVVDSLLKYRTYALVTDDKSQKVLCLIFEDDTVPKHSAGNELQQFTQDLSFRLSPLGH